MSYSGSQAGKLKASGPPVLSPESLTFVGNRKGAWVLRGHLPGPRFGLCPQSSGEPESTQKRDRNCDPTSAHAPYFRLSFPHRPDSHFTNCACERLRPLSRVAPVGSQRTNQTRGLGSSPAPSQFPGAAEREREDRRARCGTAVSALFRPIAGKTPGARTLP